MGKARALINKLKRRKKNSNKGRGDRQIDKTNLIDEKLADSPAAYKYIRGNKRRLDAAFGQQMSPSPDKIENSMLISGTLERIDFDPGAPVDNGVQLTLAAGLIEAVGIIAGDIIKVETGVLKGKELSVVSVVDATNVRLEDDADLSAQEVGAVMKVQISGVKKSHV